MTAGRVALGLLALALLVWAFGVRPARRDAALAQDAYRDARLEREILRRRIAALEVRGKPISGVDPVAQARRAVLDALAGARVQGARFEVHPEPLGASVRLRAQGGFLDLAALPSRLAGLDLARVHLAPQGPALGLEVEARVGR